MGFRKAFRNFKKISKKEKNPKLLNFEKMEYIKWKKYIIITFIDLLSVYLAVGLFMGFENLRVPRKS